MTRIFKHTLLAAIALSMLTAFARVSTAGDVEWYTDVATARKAAAEEQRPIVMFVTATWCGYCKKMEATTFKNASFTSRLQNGFVPLFIDGDEHAKLIERLKIDSYPALLVFGPDGKLRARKAGYQTAAEASAWLDSVHGR